METGAPEPHVFLISAVSGLFKQTRMLQWIAAGKEERTYPEDHVHISNEEKNPFIYSDISLGNGHSERIRLRKPGNNRTDRTGNHFGGRGG